LSLRIANILSGTETKAVNIYWFTAADASAIVIQKQLGHVIGGNAAKINIQSFQSFCENVLKEIGVLPQYQSLQLISTPEYIQILKKLIAGFPKSHPLKRYRSDVYHEIGNLLDLFSFMKTEGFTSETLLQKMNECLPGIKYVSEPNIDLESG
jgi:DNA helicase II / ATP-dependent DNA helicase PcrA